MVAVGDLIKVSKLNGVEIEDTGIIVEVFDSSFFYYSIDGLDLNNKIKNVKIEGRNLDAYTVIKRDVKKADYILNEFKRIINKKLNDSNRNLECLKDGNSEDLFEENIKNKVYKDILDDLENINNNYTEVKKGMKNISNMFNKKEMK